MSLNPAEISKLIKAQIKNVNQDIEMNESGTVLSVGDGIANVYGLKNAMMSELLLFPHDVYGMVMNLEEDQVGVVLMGTIPISRKAISSNEPVILLKYRLVTE